MLRGFFGMIGDIKMLVEKMINFLVFTGIALLGYYALYELGRLKHKLGAEHDTDKG